MRKVSRTQDPEPKRHEGHLLGPDRFKELTGVSRYVPGNAWCYDCCCPVAAEVEDKEARRA